MHKPASRFTALTIALGMAGCALPALKKSGDINPPVYRTPASLIALGIENVAAKDSLALEQDITDSLRGYLVAPMPDLQYAAILDAVTDYAVRQKLMPQGDSFLKHQSQYSQSIIAEAATRQAEFGPDVNHRNFKLLWIAVSVISDGRNLAIKIGQRSPEDRVAAAEGQLQDLQALMDRTWLILNGKEPAIEYPPLQVRPAAASVNHPK